ncbi:MAG: class I SAM-dependent methyltransferase [Ignavibacteria bacterium]|nr:class I SAM-dependent methyltransferase [Ignavibacteria bacterium]
MKKLINSVLGKFGYQLQRKNRNAKINTSNADGYPGYAEAAKKLNMDVNDYEDNTLGWVKSLPVLKEVFFPYLATIQNPGILELGPGTGRWTRHILNEAKSLNFREYILADHSQWMIDFLTSYFRDEPNFTFIKNNGSNLSDVKNNVDIIFAQGVFVALKPAYHYLYSHEFYRILNDGGYCIIDYFNCDSPEGWDYFVNESKKLNLWYTYFTHDFINKTFETAGFTFVKRFTYGKANFVVFRKP